MQFSVEHIRRTTDDWNLWEINGIEVEMRFPKSKTKNLEKALELIEKGLSESKPFSKSRKLIGASQVVTILHKVYLKEFLEVLNNSMIQTLENEKKCSIESFFQEYVLDGVWVKRVCGELSTGEFIDFKKKLLNHLLNGEIKQLDIEGMIRDGISLDEAREILGSAYLMDCIKDKYAHLIPSYLENYLERSANNRVLPTWNQFGVYVVGHDSTSAMKDIFAEYEGCSLKDLYMTKYEECALRLIESNVESINMGDDRWTLYYESKNLAIKSTVIDFSEVKSEGIKKELKWFYKHKIKEFIFAGKELRYVRGSISPVIKGMNYLSSIKSVNNISDIGAVDVKVIHQYLLNDLKLAPKSAMTVITECKQIVNYLMDAKISTLSYTRPRYNYFNNLKFRNLDKMTSVVEVIPDVVMDEILMHKSELSCEFNRMFQIFDGTGLRLKEVSYLEEDCLDYGENVLRFTPYKVIISRRKAKLSDKRDIYISEDLVRIIKSQINESKEIRETYNNPNIFLSNKSGKVRVLGQGFSEAVNRLIKKYKICDIDGSIWKFDSRQMRKTVAATMIENGANETEIMHQLGHMKRNTTRKHYEQVEKKKLADLNSEFFEKQFELKVGKENLELYSEEERRALYVDFKLNEREVEFGKCVKHKSEGECGKKEGRISCANCSKLCTGKKYLDKWNKVLQEQKSVVKDLERIYEQEGIARSEYIAFIEYKREVNQLNVYENTVNRIMEGK